MLWLDWLKLFYQPKPSFHCSMQHILSVDLLCFFSDSESFWGGWAKCTIKIISLSFYEVSYFPPLENKSNFDPRAGGVRDIYIFIILTLKLFGTKTVGLSIDLILKVFTSDFYFKYVCSNWVHWTQKRAA